MTDTNKILDVKNLITYYSKGERNGKPYGINAVDNISFELFENEILGIIGESGSGKSVTVNSIMRLIPEPIGKILNGEIIYKGKDILKFNYEELRNFRANEIGYIPQDPFTSLNPVLTIEEQIIDKILLNADYKISDAKDYALNLLEKLDIPEAKKKMKNYPFQFSGGMLQRVVIAIALANNPKVIIADEPTTSLDIPLQNKFLDLLLKIKSENESISIIFISHNILNVARICNNVIVMYGGKIQEKADIKLILNSPKHPYTQALLESVPDKLNESGRFNFIKGFYTESDNFIKGCKFANRCKFAAEKCFYEKPVSKELNTNHNVFCHLI